MSAVGAIILCSSRIYAFITKWLFIFCCTYSAQYLRLDAFGKVMSTDAYMDIAWVGMDPSLDEIKAECQDLEELQLVTGYAQIELVPTK